jgi:hypothetical protein
MTYSTFDTVVDALRVTSVGVIVYLYIRISRRMDRFERERGRFKE